ncbi:MAG TPA: hypothetical protein HA272_08380 [Methanoregula sp.]|nr:hypothetical protein [Methanoregula sp.]
MDTFQQLKKEYLEVSEENVKKRGEILLKLNNLQETSDEVKEFWKLLGTFPKNPAD